MRFFFHRMNGGYDPDTEGTECHDVQSARREAILYAAGSLRDHSDSVWAGGEMRIEVTDEQGRLVSTVIILAIDALAPKGFPPVIST